MRNIFTIFRREFASYFNSPIGYIYLIVFIVINTALFITPFFTYPRADMRYMFNLLPILLCVLMPLITMRLWAEERKDNTIEMLLTFPLPPIQLVLGKYVACCVFFILALLCTAPVPIMLFMLGGHPDVGVLLCSYLGAFLLGAFFLAVGLFLSGLVRDQIVAAVMSLAACFGLFLLGTDFIATVLDGWWPELALGSLLKRVVGVTPHYETFMRGIIGVPEFFYFVIWSSLFLFLNALYLESSCRRSIGIFFSVAFLLCMGCGVLFNIFVAGLPLGRFDFTEGKVETVSQTTKDILAKLKVPAVVNYYITPKDGMPTQLKSLEDDVVRKLDEMGRMSNGKFNYKVIHMDAKRLLDKLSRSQFQNKGEQEKKDRIKSTEETLLERGVQPFPVQIIERDRNSIQYVYSSIGVGYKEKKEQILPQVEPNNLHELEYQLASTLVYLMREKKPTVALVAPKDSSIPPYLRSMYMQMGRPLPPEEDYYDIFEQVLQMGGFELKRVAFNQKEPLPENYDALVVLNPTEYNSRQKWELARALASGKNLFLAVQSYTFNYNVRGQGVSITKNEERTDVNDWLQKYGMSVDEEVLMDVDNVPLTMTRRDPRFPMRPMLTQVDSPTHIILHSNNMNQEMSITSKITAFPYLWGSALKIDDNKIKENKLKLTKIMNTSPKAWKVPILTGMEDEIQKAPTTGQQYTVMAMLEGQFPDAYAGLSRPNWPKANPENPYLQPDDNKDEKEPPAKAIEPKPAKMMLIGGASIFRREFIKETGEFALNCVDTLALTGDLIRLRSRHTPERPISRERLTDQARTIWKTVHYVGIPGLLILIGMLRLMFRYNRRQKHAVA